MGTFNTGVIQSTGDERSFLTLIYNHIMNSWGAVSCSVKNGEDEIISPATPEDFIWARNMISYIEFALDSSLSIRLTSHPRDNSEWVSREYTVALYINGAIILDRGGTQTTDNKSGVIFCGNTSYASAGLLPSANGTRMYIMSEYVSDNVKVFWLASKDAATWKDSVITVVMLTDGDGNWYYGGISGGANPETCTLYDSVGAVTSTKSSLFSYAALTGYIDYIRESAYVSAGVKSFVTPYIYDCSTVDLGSTVTLNDGNYMAIGAHSLVKL